MKFLKDLLFLLRPFYEWIARYPLLCLLVAALMAMLAGFDGNMGLRFLFVNDEPLRAGFAAAVLLFEICFVGYLLDSDEAWMLRPDLTQASLNRNRIKYLTVTMTVLTTLAIGMAVVGSSGEFPTMFVVGLIVGVAAVAGLSWLLSGQLDRVTDATIGRTWRRLDASNVKLSHWLITGIGFCVKKPNQPQLYNIHFRAAVANTLIAVIYVSLVLLPRDLISFVSAGVAICLLLGLIAAIYGYLRFHFTQRYFFAFLVLAIVVVFRIGSHSYLHRFRGFTAQHYANPVSLDDAQKPNPNLLDDNQTLQQWKTQVDPTSTGGSNADLRQLPRLIVVSTSGGGIRAGVWTAAVLTAIEAKNPDFPKHLRLVTGASGGMYGASYYVQTLEAPGEDKTRKDLLPKIVDRIARDSLDEVARELVLGDVPHYLVGAAGSIGLRDRGTELELAWQNHTRGDDGDEPQGFAVPFSSLADGERAGWRPSLIVSPMMSDDGRRLLLSNLDLGDLTNSKGNVLGQGNDVYSVSAIEFFKLFQDVELPLSTAVRMNASFPYVSPDGTLPTDPVRRVVDAGYYDNFGVNVAAAWLYNRREWLAENTSGVLLIQIRDSQTHQKIPPSAVNGWLERGLSFLTTPFTAVMSARNSTNSFRNDSQLEAVEDILQNARRNAWAQVPNGPPVEQDVRDFFITTALELSADVSLSWSLTAEEIDEVKASAARDEITDLITKINDWLQEVQKKQL